MLAVTKAMEGNQRPLHQIGVDLPDVASSAAKVAAAEAALTKAQAGVNTVLAAFPNGGGRGVEGTRQIRDGDRESVGRSKQKLSALQVALRSDHRRVVLEQADGRPGRWPRRTRMAGKLKAAQATAENLEVALGNRLIPVLMRLMDATAKVVGWLDKHRTAALLLAGVLGVSRSRPPWRPPGRYRGRAGQQQRITPDAPDGRHRDRGLGWPDKLHSAALLLAGVLGTVLVAATVAWTASLFAAGGALAFVSAEMVIATAGLVLLVPAIVYLATHWHQVWSDMQKWAKQ